MKPITERIDNIWIQKKEDSFTKSQGFSPNTVILWANEGVKGYPIAYIKKPKGISVKDWNIIKEKLCISLLK